MIHATHLYIRLSLYAKQCLAKLMSLKRNTRAATGSPTKPNAVKSDRVWPKTYT